MVLTNDQDTHYEASTPDPEIVQLVAGVLRAVLAFLGGVGVEVGVHSDQWYVTMAGFIVLIITGVWSIYQKIRAKRIDHEGSVMTAKRNAPANAIPVPLQPSLPLVQKAI